MTSIISIKPVNADPFLITWDLGRRCNYDCSYCPSHRHDNFSPHATLDDLKKAADFIFEYAKLVAKYRMNKDFHISFTGGEPTVNPKFIDFAEYVRLKYLTDYNDYFNLKLDLTTNGAMSYSTARAIIENFDYVTVSYHAEAVSKLKKQVIDRTLQFKNSNIGLKVNVMFHSQYFEECREICDLLQSAQIKFVPRLIGDDPNSKSSRAHLYTEDQKKWLTDYWGIDFGLTSRPCCGGRTFSVCSNNSCQQTSYVNLREFKDWSCSVNWYFLHIEQQTGLVYHHQTCQAKLDGTRGSIGSLRDSKKIISDLVNHIETKTMPIIVCPNKICGCGLCTPKSKNRQDLLDILPAVIKDIDIFS